MSLIKKSIIIITIIFVCMIGFCALLLAEDKAYADDLYYEDGSTVSGIGYDLDGAQVLVEYKRYMLSVSGIYFEFDVTVDKDFYREIGEIEDNVFYPSTIIEDLGILFASVGYSVSEDAINGKVVATAKYSSLTDYYIAIGIDGYEKSDSNATIDRGFYFNTSRTNTTTPFVSIDSENSFLNKIYAKLIEAGATREGISLCYLYGTPYKIVTSDADVTERDESRNLYVHKFFLACDNADREITFVQRSPNAVGWYVTAVIIALPFILVPLIIMIVKKRKNREETNA